MTIDNSANQPAIQLGDLHLMLTSGAGEVNILRGFDLNVEQGETLGIVGPSGSGKTSLLMIIAGLETATSGEVQISGRDILTMDEDALALFRRDHVGIVFQDFHLVPTMTALENVAMPLEFAGVEDAFQRAEEELAAVGLKERVKHYPGQLSGGEKQRVALARAVVARPDILLADEPTGNLDGATGRVVMDLLFELHDRLNTTLVLITHQQELAERCHRVVELVDGLIASDNGGGEERR
ncbi:MAG: ABC transporter ATP-binding protein [Rhodospirillaceae bacterium]|jgi:putative ABC transport system ATP-binding protein|nr:ABC transporter ATP-binding protein [Rhodospirillaceae bacterium]MBT5014301.1 ABC transporter ATP-binding protein [Rhodospirillaceae bacterium]MBT6407671.1 ABC transporter ATP-binding protein [Rhodospirillaceae bacterium]MBT7357194.1 ABC transporter ATP-binding protein [Rhodospirillaceae bacterium]